VSWALDSLAAVKRIILLEDRIKNLTEQSQRLMDRCQDLDRRLIRLEAKFELLEHMAAPRRHSLPEKSEK
jgi:predicted nuclease with TOPRIM domain